MTRLSRVLTALVLACCFALAGVSATPMPADAARCTVSKAEYKKIKKGQTRAKVKKITRCSGKRVTYEGQSQTPRIKLYEYRTRA